MKPKIINLIQKNLSNEAIREITGASDSYIVDVRKQYNKLVPESERKTSTIRTKPKEGTKARIVYDYMVLYPNALLSETVANTKLPIGLCGVVRHRYFSTVAKQKRIQHGFIDYISANCISI